MRIYTSASDPLDFCRTCAPKSEETAYESYGPTVCGEGPDGRGDCFGYDCDHPLYNGEDYSCYSCKQTLTDNNA